MTHQLTLDLPEDLARALREAAAHAGQPVEQWASARLTEAARDEAERAAALEELLRHTVSLGYPTGADNEQIDADLAREYGDTHEPKSPR